MAKPAMAAAPVAAPPARSPSIAQLPPVDVPTAGGATSRVRALRTRTGREMRSSRRTGSEQRAQMALVSESPWTKQQARDQSRQDWTVKLFGEHRGSRTMRWTTVQAEGTVEIRPWPRTWWLT